MHALTETYRMHKITINDKQRLALMSILDHWFTTEHQALFDDDYYTEFAVRLNTLLHKAATA
jgi:hypothetical protein